MYSNKWTISTSLLSEIRFSKFSNKPFPKEVFQSFNFIIAKAMTFPDKMRSAFSLQKHCTAISSGAKVPKFP